MTRSERVRITAIGMISLRSRAIEESAQFYTDTFDMEARFERNALTRICTLLPSPDDPHQFSIQLTEGRPLNGRETFAFIGLAVNSDRDVDVIHQRAVRCGARTTPPHLRDTHWQVIIFDPDGHKIRVISNSGDDQTPAEHIATPKKR